MRSLRERLLGTPELLDGPGLLRVLRRGTPSLRVRAARALSERPEAQVPPALIPLLEDPLPGVRRAAARGLGWRADPDHRAPLAQAAARERCTTPLVAMLAAQVRCGGPPEAALEAARAHGGRRLRTSRGWRSPGPAAGFGPEACAREVTRLLASPEALRSEAEADPLGAGRQALEDLAALGHPEDLDRLRSLARSAGRRGRHGLIVAQGLAGDPRALPALCDLLERMDVDPGRGFAQRRLAATAIGRVGSPEVSRRLVRALEIEALEHEGRPGAGLGVQYPVRTNLLWALGEIQAADAAAVLCGYLDNLHGSALGGFYLPAMDALVKIGPPARPHLEAVARSGGGDAARNAEGVLEALSAG
ncbi:MAG: HEAT repeat domain-containing protein [Alphaproteobacteria bacterium]|nr:HEAT repeat domain-containing protein [Alphaproteobacteria bacterium]